MKKNIITYFVLILLMVTSPLAAYSVRVGQSLLFSAYDETSGLSNPFAQEESANYLGPLYTVGYYFLNTRVQELGENDWALRGNFKVKMNSLNGSPPANTDLYEPEVRNLYLENQDPLGGHFYFSAGRMRSPFMLPVLRLDGAMAAFTPNEKENLLIGVIGGQVPLEDTGYRDYYYPPYRAGGFLEARLFSSNTVKMQYNSGFDESGADMIHQGLWQSVHDYSIAGKKSYLRTGLLFTMPDNVFDYAFVENGFVWSQNQTHSLSFLRNETLYRLSPTEVYKEEFQEVYYRLYYKTENDKWRINAGGGYSGALSHNGYVAEAKLVYNSMFLKNDSAFADARSRDRGETKSTAFTVGYGVFPLYFVNLQAYAGYEKFTLHTIETPIRIVGIDFESSIKNLLYFQFEFEGRSFADSGTEVTATGILSYYFRYRSKEKEQAITGTDIQPEG